MSCKFQGYNFNMKLNENCKRSNSLNIILRTNTKCGSKSSCTVKFDPGLKWIFYLHKPKVSGPNKETVVTPAMRLGVPWWAVAFGSLTPAEQHVTHTTFRLSYVDSSGARQHSPGVISPGRRNFVRWRQEF
jgi:hypothetical protein